MPCRCSSAPDYGLPAIRPHPNNTLDAHSQGVRLSNVLYAWELPLLKQSIPWAITANMAVRSTTLRCGAEPLDVVHKQQQLAFTRSFTHCHS
jgi:hypothetical protein